MEILDLIIGLKAGIGIGYLLKSKFSKEHVRMFRILLSIATLSMKNSKLFKKVEFMANVDGLTKLYTHRYFQEFLSDTRNITYLLLYCKNTGSIKLLSPLCCQGALNGFYNN